MGGSTRPCGGVIQPEEALSCQTVATEPSLPLFHKSPLGPITCWVLKYSLEGLIKHWASHQVLTHVAELSASGCTAPAVGSALLSRVSLEPSAGLPSLVLLTGLSLAWDCPVPCRVSSGVPGLYLPDIRTCGATKTVPSDGWAALLSIDAGTWVCRAGSSGPCWDSSSCYEGPHMHGRS